MAEKTNCVRRWAGASEEHIREALDAKVRVGEDKWRTLLYVMILHLSPPHMITMTISPTSQKLAIFDFTYQQVEIDKVNRLICVC